MPLPPPKPTPTPCIMQAFVGDKAQVDALLFAPPNVGDRAFVNSFGRKVNARRILFLNDVVPQVPCSPTMIACSTTLVPTPNLFSSSYSYAPVSGTLQLNGSDMPQQAEAWSLLNVLHACQAERFILASHICSYNCFFSQYVKENSNMCLLWAAAGEEAPPTYQASGPATPDSTFCFKFPVDPGQPQYPYKPVT